LFENNTLIWVLFCRSGRLGSASGNRPRTGQRPIGTAAGK